MTDTPASRPEPKPGDRYYTGFEHWPESRRFRWRKIRSVDGEWAVADGVRTWSITADDNVGYDCVWSDNLGAWCYGLSSQEPQ